MAGLKLVWTETAIKQRNYIFEYWNERNGSTQYSKKLNIKIRKRVVLLKMYPNLGKKAHFGNTRVISLGHYSILYKKVNLNIIITGFWDNRQDPGKLINFLKKN